MTPIYTYSLFSTELQKQFSQWIVFSTKLWKQLGVGYLFMAAPARHRRCSLPWTRGISLPPLFLQRRIAPLCAPVPALPPLLGLLLLAAGPGLGRGWLLPTVTPGLSLGVAPQGHCPWPRARGGFSRLPRPRTRDSSSRPPPLTSDAG